MVGTVLIVDQNPDRAALGRKWLGGASLQLSEAASPGAALAAAAHNRPDLILLRMSFGIDFFRELAAVAERSGTFLAICVESSIQPDFRREVLSLTPEGFICDEWRSDEKLAVVEALLRTKRRLDASREKLGGNGPSRLAAPVPAKTESPPAPASQGNEPPRRLRDRSPELYQAILRQYEEGIKLVLQNRIYKINDDIFEPFRQIARQLYLADATARDAVELHYQTLRKIAPSPEIPRAQAYLEVGRTTIIGLMGDLITCYRETARRPGANEQAHPREDAGAMNQHEPE